MKTKALDKIRKKENELGENHPSLTDDLVEFAKLLESEGKYEEAERIYSRIQDIWEAVFDPQYGFRHFLSDIFGVDSAPDRTSGWPGESRPLSLTHELFLGAGCNRICYSFPGNPDLCIKIDRPWNGGPNNSRRMRMKKALMPWLNSISCNKDEVRFYWKKARHMGEEVYQHAPRCFGVVMTNLGPGLVCERIRDHDGNFSERLGDFLIKRPEKGEHLLSLTEDLFAFFRKHDIILFCWNTDNILVRQDPVNGDRLVAIDWKSEHRPNDDLPLTTLFPSLARRKMERKVQELKKWIIDHSSHPDG